MLEKGDSAESATGQARNQTWSIGTPVVASEPWPANALFARLVRDAGMSTRASEVQLEKAEAAMEVRLEQTERSTDVSCGQFWKTDVPNEVILQSFGKATDERDVQFWKTELPSVASFVQGDMSADRSPDPLNALSLIVARFGQFANGKFVKDEQP